VPAPKLIFFDCDSTLSSIEGIDELARIRGGKCYAEVEAMTSAAMDGKVPIDEIFGRRLDIIRPTRDEVALVAQKYIDEIEPTALVTIRLVKDLGWTPIILSAGFTQVIAPLAALLGIDRIEAVGLKFDERGDYADYEREFPTTRNGGKPARILQMKSELHPIRTIMVGDGISDLETTGMVDLFVGFGGYVQRTKVQTNAQIFIHRLSELSAHLS
jgi:phosphoserine phosphatase